MGWSFGLSALMVFMAYQTPLITAMLFTVIPPDTGMSVVN